MLKTKNRWKESKSLGKTRHTAFNKAKIRFAADISKEMKTEGNVVTF